MEITRNGSQPSGKGPDEYFTGTVRVDPLFQAPDPARVDGWDFVDANGNFTAPATSQFAVTVNGSPVAVQSVGFKRRPFYAPLATRDLRLDNCLVLQLASSIADTGETPVRPGSPAGQRPRAAGPSSRPSPP